MSIFNNILFLHDPPTGGHGADPVPSSYSQGYGNRIASARVFAPLGHSRHADHAGAPKRRFAVSATGPCPLRACG